MILNCPACSARFKVPDIHIPPGGRTVRCGKCQHEWHVSREASFEAHAVAPMVQATEPSPTADDIFDELVKSTAAAEVTTIQNNPTRAVKKRKPLNPRPFKIAAPVLAAVWLVLAFITYFPSWMKAPGLSGLYSAFGTTPVDGLGFSDVHMEREQEGSKTKFILSGSIHNYTSVARTVPTVRVVLRDKNNKSLWSRDYVVNTELKAGEVYPFRISNVETSFASSVKAIVVDLGNTFQLMVR